MVSLDNPKVSGSYWTLQILSEIECIFQALYLCNFICMLNIWHFHFNSSIGTKMHLKNAVLQNSWQSWSLLHFQQQKQYLKQFYTNKYPHNYWIAEFLRINRERKRGWTENWQMKRMIILISADFPLVRCRTKGKRYQHIGQAIQAIRRC